MVVIHQGRSLGFFHHGPRGENRVERQRGVAKGPRFVDAHHGEVFHGHGHAAVDHLVVFRCDFTRTVVLVHRSLEQGGFIHDVDEGQRFEHVTHVGLGFAGDGGRQDNATVFGHVLRRWPLAQSGDDVLAQSVGQLAVEGFGTEESDGALVGDGRAGIGGFGVVEGDVAPIGVLVVHNGPHFKRLGDHEFQIEEATTVNPLPAEDEGAVVEFR